ncbi:MAG: hypothetical protein CMN76_00810 [Spirochaetaceae bacterium]|nr:hypothetical protein [Spirochaetaceae bacterium]
MKISSRPLRRILPARIVRLLPYVLAAGLALLHLLVWFRFKGLEEAKRQKELQEAATDISRQIQKRIDFYGSELLALRSLFEASDQVTPADWKAFLRTMGADRDPVILDFAVGTISPQGAFRPYYSKTGNPGWLAEGTKARKRLVQQEEISPEVFPDPVLIKENGSGHQFQLFRLIRERGFLVAAIRLDGDRLFHEMRAEYPTGLAVEIFLPSPEQEALNRPQSASLPVWSPISPPAKEQGQGILFHGPYFRYSIQASEEFFRLYSGADQGLFRSFFLVGGLMLSFLLGLLFYVQGRTRTRAVDLARKMARAFRMSRSRQAQVFRKNRAVQLLLEPGTARIVDANEAAIQYYGYDKEELLNKSVFDINTATKEEILAAMERARTLGQSHFEFKHQLKNGEIRDVEVYSGPLHFRGKMYLYSIVHDVTARKQLEKELVQAKESAQAASRAKSVFLANMSHELRTPMYSLAGMAELLSETNLSEDQKEYLAVLQKSSRALLDVVNNILDVSRIESGKMTLDSSPFSPQSVFDRVRDIMAPVARQKGLLLRVESRLDPALVVMGDAFRIQQVLLNLVGNSIKFTRAGEVVIQADPLASHPLTGSEDSPPTLEVVRIGVRDTGPGISKEDMGQIFDAFYQTESTIKQKKGGSGLGLNICKKIVELMGSSLRVISHPGEGSHFFFTVQLPSATAPEDTEAIDAEPVNDEPGKARILIVEDNKDNQMLVLKLLSRGPYELDTAWNGKEALKKTADRDYDLILMDLQMPELDGLNACKLIKRRYARRASYQRRNCPRVVALTASSMEEDKNEALAAGMLHFISKPVSPSTLRSIVARTLSSAPKPD